MKIYNIQNYNSQHQSFTGLEKIIYNRNDFASTRLAIALKDSKHFNEFCKTKDVFVSIATPKVEGEFDKPVITIKCQKPNNKIEQVTKSDDMVIKFSGDTPLPKRKEEENFTPFNCDKDYLNTICNVITTVTNFTEKKYHEMLEFAKANKTPFVIDLSKLKF